MTPRSVVQQTLDGLEPSKREAFLKLNPGLRALATQRDAACPPSERAALDVATKARAQHAAQGAAAQASGGSWERDVFDALGALALTGDVAWWEHTGPGVVLVGGVWTPTKRALCDVVGAVRGGRVLVAEVKRTVEGAVDLRRDSTARARVKPHQADQLAATGAAGGVALLVVEVRGVAAVIPWRAVQGLEVVNVDVARRHEARRGLADALRREMGGA
jgi:Holliday junction resolvase